MILQYFKKKENKYKKIANQVYTTILSDTRFLIKKNYFTDADFNLSFEIISILIIYFLKKIKINNKIEYKKINTEIVNNLVTDLDNTFREMGIGDMSIGKHVKKYVRKFYFRVKQLDPVLSNNELNLLDYLVLIKKFDKNYIPQLSKDLGVIFIKINKNIEKL